MKKKKGEIQLSEKTEEDPPFLHGSKWLRTDFHLHTKADKEFSFTGDENFYNSEYVQALKKSRIGIGVVTNHNKFDYAEFKSLRKTAKKENIFLLPGVELSVGDGSNGIHTIIVFSDEWLIDGKDHINPFLQTAFAGKTPSDYENGNARCSLGLIPTIRKLEEQHKDFFIIFAHVEDKSGFWKELGGGRITELGKQELFITRCLGFQKVRTHDSQEKACRLKVKQWLGTAYPAEVEGSDAKNIDEIGKGNPFYVKVGAFSFEALKFALMDRESRTAVEMPMPKHSRIKNIQFQGGILDGKSICFSSGLNCLIGIRGSGKSAVLEAIRYTLDLQFGEKTVDREYKKDLPSFTLGSGGKIVLQGTDPSEQEFVITRILHEAPAVSYGGEYRAGINIKETALYQPLYFGQKDLASTGEPSVPILLRQQAP